MGGIAKLWLYFDQSKNEKDGVNALQCVLINSLDV